MSAKIENETASKPKSNFSLVSETPAAEPAEAYRHFVSKLAFETDPADIMLDLERGQNSFMIIDVRSREDFAECHITGARNFPYRTINAETTADLPKDKVLIVYCWGHSCNSSTKAAARLSALGFKVKELLGDLEYWRKEGGQISGTLGEDAPLVYVYGRVPGSVVKSE